LLENRREMKHWIDFPARQRHAVAILVWLAFWVLLRLCLVPLQHEVDRFQIEAAVVQAA
jgi:hypothetical protein